MTFNKATAVTAHGALSASASRRKRHRAARARASDQPPIAVELLIAHAMPTLDDVLERLRNAHAERAYALRNARPQAFRLVELERWYVNEVVSACRGNRSMAARVLGVARRSVQRILNRAPTIKI